MSDHSGTALLAPIGFVVGLILVLLPLSVALPAIVLAVLAMLAFQHFHLFFGIGTLGVVSFGFILQVDPWRFILGGGTLLLPILFSMATERALGLPTKLVENRH